MGTAHYCVWCNRSGHAATTDCQRRHYLRQAAIADDHASMIRDALRYRYLRIGSLARTGEDLDKHVDEAMIAEDAAKVLPGGKSS